MASMNRKPRLKGKMVRVSERELYQESQFFYSYPLTLVVLVIIWLTSNTYNSNPESSSSGLPIRNAPIEINPDYAKDVF